MTASLILEKLSRVETKNYLLGRESLDRRYSLSIIMNLVLNERGFILLYNCVMYSNSIKFQFMVNLTKGGWKVCNSNNRRICKHRHYGNRSFRTQVVFVPKSFRTQNIRPKSFRLPKSFRTQVVSYPSHFVPKSFRTQANYNYERQLMTPMTAHGGVITEIAIIQQIVRSAHCGTLPNPILKERLLSCLTWILFI